jgi:hypothetical protein
MSGDLVVVHSPIALVKSSEALYGAFHKDLVRYMHLAL